MPPPFPLAALAVTPPSPTEPAPLPAGPNANGYQTQVTKATPEQFVKAQYGMITEALTHYGFIDRLWWDHYEDGCGGLSECPPCPEGSTDPYCFPRAWANFTSLVHRISPGTLMGTGPDIAHSAGGEGGGGQYPAWNTCNTTDGSPLSRCETYGTDPYGQIFRPFEADATIQNPGDVRGEKGPRGTAGDGAGAGAGAGAAARQPGAHVAQCIGLWLRPPA